MTTADTEFLPLEAVASIFGVPQSYSMVDELNNYVCEVWGRTDPNALIEVSTRVNGRPGREAAAKKVKWRTKHVRIGDLANNAEALTGLLDMANHENRVDVYFGCMPLTEAPERGRGRGDLRHSVPGIWFDIDAQAPGREKSSKKTPEYPNGAPLFETPMDARTALFEYLKTEHDISPSIVTNSGYGIHAWVLFDRPGPPEMVELVRHWNEEFADWCMKHHRVHVDQVGDRTRVLRVPGTTNWRGADTTSEAEVVEINHMTWGDHYSPFQLGWGPAMQTRIEEERRRAIERSERGRAAGDQGDECALFDGRCALDACSWAEILGPAGWKLMEPEGVVELERWGRPRGDGSDGVSSAVVFEDAPWVLVVFSEAAGLPAWDEVKRGAEKPNTKWRTWVRLKYEGDEMRAASDAVLVGMHGYPTFWPAAAVKVLENDAEIVRAWMDSRSVVEA